MSDTEVGDGLLEVLKELAGTETVDGADVEATAEMVDLDIAWKLLIVEHPIGQEDDELFAGKFITSARKIFH